MKLVCSSWVCHAPTMIKPHINDHSSQKTMDKFTANRWPKIQPFQMGHGPWLHSFWNEGAPLDLLMKKGPVSCHFRLLLYVWRYASIPVAIYLCQIYVLHRNPTVYMILLISRQLNHPFLDCRVYSVPMCSFHTYLSIYNIYVYIYIHICTCV